MIYLNLETFGYPQWVPVCDTERDIIYHGALDLHREHDKEHIRAVIDITRATLRNQARRGEIDPTWLTTCTMVIALSGLAGDELPRHACDDA
jgi:hypothetical protein